VVLRRTGDLRQQEFHLCNTLLPVALVLVLALVLICGVLIRAAAPCTV
jgi:hypothetical protein